jgi:hypothetical protein
MPGIIEGYNYDTCRQAGLYQLPESVYHSIVHAAQGNPVIIFRK